MKIFNRVKGYFRRHGHGKKEYECTPEKVEELAGEVIVDVACGSHHILAVTSTGSIYTFGHNGCGNNANSLSTPLLDLSSKGVISVSAGWNFTA